MKSLNYSNIWLPMKTKPPNILLTIPCLIHCYFNKILFLHHYGMLDVSNTKMQMCTQRFTIHFIPNAF